MIKKPFRNLKVVELASVLAGPSVGMFFGELGAQVLKIENKTTGGDVTRTWRTSYENINEISNYYTAVNGYKKTILKDLLNKKDWIFTINKIKKADILIVNFGTKELKKFNLQYKSLKKLNSKLIFANITGYGVHNPKPAFDLVLQAETGFMFLNSKPNGEPLKMPVALIDVLAAHHLKEGILSALYLREKNHIGANINVSLLDVALSSLINVSSNYINTKISPVPSGSLHPNIAPYGETFKTADDRYFVLAIGNDAQFEKLILFLKIKMNLKYNSNEFRVINRISLFKLLAAKIKKFRSTILTDELTKLGVPCAVVSTIDEALAKTAALKLVVTHKSGILKGKKNLKSVAFNHT